MLGGMSRGLLVLAVLAASVGLLAGCGKKKESGATQAPAEDARAVRPADAGVPPADAVPATPPGTPDIEVPAPVLE